MDPLQSRFIDKEILYDLGFLKIEDKKDLLNNSKYVLAQIASLVSFIVLGQDSNSRKTLK